MVNPNDPNAPHGSYDAPGGEEELLESPVPEVAASPRRALLIMALLLAGGGFVLYNIFSGDKVEKAEEKKETVQVNNSEPIAPPPPAPVAPQVPEPLPAPPSIEPPPAPVAQPVQEEDKNGRLQRLQSAMVIVDSQQKPADNTGRTQAETALAGRDLNTDFAMNAAKTSKADKAVAGKIDNLRTTIAQGKIIDAVLETAINTDLPGPLRAIVSRDVFAESGVAPLIPKGSRLIGTYNTGILRGQRRIYVLWTRVIRPDGIDVFVNSPGVDQLGRAGIRGEVDNKYMEIFSAAILTSAISLGTAVAADSVTDNNVSTTTNSTGGSTTTGSAGSIAAADAVRNLGEIGKSVTTGLLDQRPTLTVDQGSRINVFVNRDLEFPTSVLKNQFVQ